MSLGVFADHYSSKLIMAASVFHHTKATCSFQNEQIPWDVKTYSSCTKLLEVPASV
ncbi:uncharacterized protein J3R85_000441 [Psidium guajava]|nr:uncharacterized protein J3R85_000441 [Psidium guajava]